MNRQKGFTLVELAIVVTIVALLIGGVLKGQEMLENSRITSSGIQIKALNAAVSTFRTKYRSLPGDLPSPSTRLQGCTASPCSVAGNGNGVINNVSTGTAAFISTDESGTFWYHLKAAGLITDIPIAADGVMYLTNGLTTDRGMLSFWSYTYVDNAWFPGGLESPHWWYVALKPSTNFGYVTPVNLFMKYDIKFDDGRPFGGDALVNGGGCGITAGDAAYNPNNSNPCIWQIRPRI